MGIVQCSSHSGRRTLRTKLSRVAHRNLLHGGGTNAMIDLAGTVNEGVH